MITAINNHNSKTNNNFKGGTKFITEKCSKGLTTVTSKPIMEPEQIAIMQKLKELFTSSNRCLQGEKKNFIH